MISNKLHNSIQELAQLSDMARAVANRLSERRPTGVVQAGALAELDDQNPGVEELKQQVAALQKLVSELGSIIEDEAPGTELTDTQASDFSTRFTKSLGTTHPAVLARVYNKQYYASVPRNVRMLMATALVNHASKTPGFETPDVWNTLLANSGYL